MDTLHQRRDRGLLSSTNIQLQSALAHSLIVRCCVIAVIADVAISAITMSQSFPERFNDRWYPSGPPLMARVTGALFTCDSRARRTDGPIGLLDM